MNVRMLHGAGHDFVALSRDQGLDAVALLRRLVDDPYGCGSKALDAPCAHQVFPNGASLVGWRSVKVPSVEYFDTITIVYRPCEDGFVEVLAVAPRTASECYRRAMARLAEHEQQRAAESRWKRYARMRIEEQRRARERLTAPGARPRR